MTAKELRIGSCINMRKGLGKNGEGKKEKRTVFDVIGGSGRRAGIAEASAGNDRESKGPGS